MKAMKEQDRARLRRMASMLAQDNARRESLSQAICREAAEGHITRRECLALIKPTANTVERKAFADAMSRLIRQGKVRERPMIEPEPHNRAVRIEPVMVLELVP
jgi:hypothetical protein